MKTNPITTFIQLFRKEKIKKIKCKKKHKKRRKKKSYLNLIMREVEKRKEKTNS
jgi:predicted RNase H-like nuclease